MSFTVCNVYEWVSGGDACGNYSKKWQLLNFPAEFSTDISLVRYDIWHFVIRCEWQHRSIVPVGHHEDIVMWRQCVDVLMGGKAASQCRWPWISPRGAMNLIVEWNRRIYWKWEKSTSGMSASWRFKNIYIFSLSLDFPEAKRTGFSVGTSLFGRQWFIYRNVVGTWSSLMSFYVFIDGVLTLFPLMVICRPLSWEYDSFQM
jgi:hypothetical protein